MPDVPKTTYIFVKKINGYPFICHYIKVKALLMSTHNVFSCRNKKNISIFWLKKCLIWSYSPVRILPTADFTVPIISVDQFFMERFKYVSIQHISMSINKGQTLIQHDDVRVSTPSPFFFFFSNEVIH